MEPVNIEQLPNDIAINWSDGHETYIDLVTLRDACPCAACRGETHLWGKTSPTIDKSDLSEESFKMGSFHGVGNYAVQFVWQDRHDSGIYSYDVLRALCQCAECSAKRAAK